MQDKRIDDKFINHAWEQMLVTLDQEMPTEQKRRRIVLIPWRWAAAASVLLLLTIGAGWWLHKQNTQTVVADNSQYPTTIEQLVYNEDCPEVEMEQLATTHSTNENLPPTIPAHTSSKFPAKNFNIASTQTSKNQTVVKSLQQVIDMQSEPLEMYNPSKHNIAENTAITTTLTQVAANEIITPVQILDAQQIALLEKEKVSLEKKPELACFCDDKEEKSTKNQRLNVGLEFATYASAGSALDGYAGGAIVEVPTQSEKFNVRTGLNFNASQRYFDSNVTVLESDRTAGFGPATVLVDPQPDLQVSAQQLSLPLTVAFKPRQSWGLEGGLQASYLLGARNLKGAEAYQTLAGFTNGNAEVTTFINSLSNKAAQLNTGSNYDSSVNNGSLNVNAFRRFDVAVTAGFGVYPTENLGVRLQYQRGLIDMLKADQFKTFGNNVRLSAVYFFK